MDKNLLVDRNILIYSFRYALGRKSYSPGIVIDNIKNNIDKISSNDIELYIKEIDEYSGYGLDFDKNMWMEFSDYLKSELKKR